MVSRYVRYVVLTRVSWHDMDCPVSDVCCKPRLHATVQLWAGYGCHVGQHLCHCHCAYVPQALSPAIFTLKRAIHGFLWVWGSSPLSFYIYCFIWENKNMERVRELIFFAYWISDKVVSYLLFLDLMENHQGLKSEKNLLLYQYMYMMTFMKMVFIW